MIELNMGRRSGYRLLKKACYQQAHLFLNSLWHEPEYKKWSVIHFLHHSRCRPCIMECPSYWGCVLYGICRFKRFSQKKRRIERNPLLKSECPFFKGVLYCSIKANMIKSCRELKTLLDEGASDSWEDISIKSCLCAVLEWNDYGALHKLITFVKTLISRSTEQKKEAPKGTIHERNSEIVSDVPGYMRQLAWS